MAKTSLFYKIYNAGPLLLLYYLCISEVDTNLEKIFEIFTLNFQIILIYFWIIKRPSLMGTGHIFSAGLINDVVMGFPLGISSLIEKTCEISFSKFKDFNPAKDKIIPSYCPSFNFLILVSTFPLINLHLISGLIFLI